MAVMYLPDNSNITVSSGTHLSLHFTHSVRLWISQADAFLDDATNQP